MADLVEEKTREATPPPTTTTTTETTTTETTETTVIKGATADDDFWTEIEVCNPTVIGSLHTKHVIYEIKTPKNKNSSAILRRYGDFCWLFDRLRFERGGSIIYPLPPKQKGSHRFTPAFIEGRREQLQIFLRLSLRNVELRKSPSLDAFLHCPNLLFTSIRLTNNDDALNELLKQTMTFEFEADPTMFKYESASMFTFHKNLMVSPTTIKHKYDDIFADAMANAIVLESQIKLVIQQVTLLSQRAMCSSKGMVNLGKAFETIAKMETDRLAHSCREMVKVTSLQSSMTQSYAKETKDELQKPLDCFIFVILGWKMALLNREKKRSEYAALLNKVKNREKYFEKITALLEKISIPLEAETTTESALEEQAIDEAVDGLIKKEAAAAETQKEEEKVVKDTLGEEAAKEVTRENKTAKEATTKAVVEESTESAKNTLSFAERREIYFNEKSKKRAAYYEDKKQQSKLAVDEVHMMVEKMRVAYDAMNERLYREMQRYNEEKGQIMSEIVTYFAEHEAKYNNDGAETWKSTLKFIADYKPEAVAEEKVDGSLVVATTDPVSK